MSCHCASMRLLTYLQFFRYFSERYPLISQLIVENKVRSH